MKNPFILVSVFVVGLIVLLSYSLFAGLFVTSLIGVWFWTLKPVDSKDVEKVPDEVIEKELPDNISLCSLGYLDNPKNTEEVKSELK